jgi:hypothetical protein
MKYNLGEEEDLTHLGQSLSTIEKFEKPMSDDDSDSDDDRNGGKLGGLEHIYLFFTVYFFIAFCT